MSWTPASTSAGTWCRHNRPESGNPWRRTTGRPSPVTSNSIPTPFTSMCMSRSLSCGQGGQELPAGRAQARAGMSLRSELADLVAEVRSGHRLPRPFEHPHLVQKSPEAVGIEAGGELQGLDDLPAGIVGPVGLPPDLGVDVGQTVTVE